jgi:hypothetical protein
MAFVDPELHARGIEALTASYLENKDKPGADGAISRALPVVLAFHEWLKGEIERDLEAIEINDAACRFIGNMVGSFVQGGAADGHFLIALGFALQQIANTAIEGVCDGNHTSAHVHQGRRQ